jgi:hypothetical protein
MSMILRPKVDGLGGEGFLAGDPAGHRDLDCGGSVVVGDVLLVALEALH